MTRTIDTADGLARHIGASLPAQRRLLVAIAGVPASGKSTLAIQVRDAVRALGQAAQVVPMDGFHLDNVLLRARGLLHRKGAPETFDVMGFARLVAALKGPGDVFYPVFDRSRDLAVAAAGVVEADCRVAIIEGNYLLFDEPGWRDLAENWDISVWADVDDATARARLIGRWLGHGLTRDAAEARVEANDMPNAARIRAAALASDLHIDGG